MYRPLLLIFFLFPLIDLALLGWIGSEISWDAVLLMVLLTGVLGILVIRHNGRHIRRTLAAMFQGAALGRQLFDRVLVLLAGVLLVLPGPLGDLIGGLLLIPPLRRLAVDWVARHVVQPAADPQHIPDDDAAGDRSPRHVNVQIIDVEHRPASDHPDQHN